jgi:23S rRNA (guanosine2251-2'-O)-methyltransferase
MSKQILFGLHTVKAALANSHRHHKVLYLTSKSQNLLKELNGNLPPVKIIPLKELEQKVPPQSVHQQIVLETSSLPPLSIEEICQRSAEETTLVILDQVTDPHNVGAILRSCAAFNVNALILTTDHSSKTNSAILAKTASGALELVPLIEITNLASTLDFLKTQGFWCYGLDEEGSAILGKTKLDGKIALVMGAEGKGLRRLTKDRCDQLIRLPTNPNFPTLNVSNALAITLFEKYSQSR